MSRAAPPTESGTSSTGPRRARRWLRVFAAVLVLCAVHNGVTGFGRSFVGRESGAWMLLLHVTVALPLLLCLMGVALLGAGRHSRTQDAGGPPLILRAAFWLVLVLGLAVALTILPAMLTVFGYSEMRTLIELHEKAAIAFLVALGVWMLAGIWIGKAKS